MNSIILISK